MQQVTHYVIRFNFVVKQVKSHIT